MDTSEKVEYWINGAQSNLKAARSLLRGKNYLECGFFCHLTIEKALKATIAKTAETPPPVHNLTLLAQKTEIYNDMSTPQRRLLSVLNPLNIQARYPQYKSDMAEIWGKKECAEILKGVKELLCWIKTKL